MTVHNEKCQWNLVNKSVVEGKRADWWALIDFTSKTRSKLHADGFIKNLTQRSRHLGMHMEEPVFCKTLGMNAFASVKSITDVLESVINHSKAKSKGPLQIIICVMADKHPGYKYLKWVSETHRLVWSLNVACSLQLTKGMISIWQIFVSQSMLNLGVAMCILMKDFLISWKKTVSCLLELM